MIRRQSSLLKYRGWIIGSSSVSSRKPIAHCSADILVVTNSIKQEMIVLQHKEQGF